MDHITKKKKTKSASKQRLELARDKCHKAIESLMDEMTPMYISPILARGVPDPDDVTKRLHTILCHFASDINRPKPSYYAAEEAHTQLCQQCMEREEYSIVPSYLFFEWKQPESPILELIEEIICSDVKQ